MTVFHRSLPSIKKCRQNVKDSTAASKAEKKGIHFKHSNKNNLLLLLPFAMLAKKTHLAPPKNPNMPFASERNFTPPQVSSFFTILGAPYSEGKGLGDQHFKIQVGHPGKISGWFVGSHLYRGCWWEHICIYIYTQYIIYIYTYTVYHISMYQTLQ